ncbi:MAG: hypothetical protein HUJ29_12035 [Gammaproteobacteria bacterium]|nr:hypothetical protein [Gammaproteobacteria bacterium]
MYRYLFAALALFVTTPAWAGSVDASINDSSVNVTLGWVQNNKSPDALQIQLGYLTNLQRNSVISAGVQVIGETGKSDNPLELGVGFKFLGVDSASSGLLYGLALGVELRYYPKNINRLALTTQLNYGPNVVVSSPAESMMELGVRAEYQILPQAFAYAGFRTFDIGLSGGGNDLIDNGFHVGVRVLFQ